MPEEKDLSPDQLVSLYESLALIPEAWDRQIIIGVPGSGDEQAFSVAQIVDFTTEHFVEHLDEIERIKANYDS